jgi:phospholipid-transporting ATPase
MVRTLADESAPEHTALLRVVLFLATCHTIIVDKKKGKYNSASPDELALVNAAKQFGYEFLEKDPQENVIILDKRNNRKLSYQLLNVCEFTSTRKRMSCIYRDPQGRLLLMCKGADNVITDRLSADSRAAPIFQTTQRSCDRYAQEGLRTLFLAEKYLDERVYAKWNEKQFQASLEVQNREEKVAAVDEEIE